MVAAPLTRWERLRLLDRKCQKLKDAMGAALCGVAPAEARGIPSEVAHDEPIKFTGYYPLQANSEFDKFPVFARRMSFRCTPEVAQAFEEQRRAITAAVKYVDYNIGNYDGGGNDDDYDDD